MKINTKTRYGLRTMVEIAMQKQETGILQKEISKRQDISEKYLDHIIAALKSAGLITNVGGKKSGYRLTRPAKDINIYDIYQAFNSAITLVTCLSDNTRCKKENTCIARSYWQDMNEMFMDKMKSQSIKDLADKQAELNKNKEKHIMYHI